MTYTQVLKQRVTGILGFVSDILRKFNKIHEGGTCYFKFFISRDVQCTYMISWISLLPVVKSGAILLNT